MDYMIARAGQQFGPFPQELVEQWRREGQIADTDLCWCEGMAGWQLVVNVFDHHDDEEAEAGAPAPSARADRPESPPPPSLHWGIVLLLSVLTLGLFGWIWVFVQASWVRRFDPRCPGMALYALALGIYFGGGFASGYVGLTDRNTADTMQLITAVCGGIAYVVANFKIRDALEAQFTSVEPFNLSLSGVMTFFFGFLYFQYHLCRIADWKRTGQLPG